MFVFSTLFIYTIAKTIDRFRSLINYKKYDCDIFVDYGMIVDLKSEKKIYSEEGKNHKLI